MTIQSKEASSLTIEVITVARFADIIAANIAKQNLEAEEIPAFLTDEMTINVAWYLTVAIGGIRLQVPAPEAERAISVLTRIGVDDPLAEIESEEILPSNSLAELSDNFDGEENAVRLSWADWTVERMFRVAVLSLYFFPPLQLYSLWLSIRLLVSGRPVSLSQWWKIGATIIFSAPLILLLWTLLLPSR